MTKRNEIYKCKICSNVIEVLHQGEGTLVCCAEEMNLLKENIPDIENAHYAFIEEINDIEKKVIIKHIATREHHIECIEIISNDNKFLKRKYLEELEPPEMTFKCTCKEGFYIRLYCNLDGVWVTNKKEGEN